MKNKIFNFLMLSVFIMLLQARVDVSQKDGNSLNFANIEALAQNEGAGTNCPNGGYWSTGSRSESRKAYWEKVDINLGSLGFFDNKGEDGPGISWSRVVTVSYNCDQSNSKPCLVCNRYKL